MVVTLQETSICVPGQMCTITGRQACSMQDTDHQLTSNCGFTCDTRNRVCASRIGLFSHRRRSHHLWSADPSSRQLTSNAITMLTITDSTNETNYLSSNPASQLLSTGKVAQHCHARCAYFKQFNTEKCSHVPWMALQTRTINTIQL